MGSMAFCPGGGPPEGACCPGGGGYFQRAAVHPPSGFFSGTALTCTVSKIRAVETSMTLI